MNVSIIGCGAYGLALSHIFVKNNNKVVMYNKNKSEIKFLKEKRESEKLKDYKISSKVKFTSNIKQAVKNADIVVIAVPAKAVEEVSIEISKYIDKHTHILIASKGILNETCEFLSDVVSKYINTNKIAVISGPSFAVDIVKDQSIGLSLATTNNMTKNIIKKAMESDSVKLRETTDVIGVEICGAIKNVMAIMSGMLEGMKVSDSTKALFLTESLNDIKELIDALDGNKKSILSFAGFGDILMTCSSDNSRNYSYGKLIGKSTIDKANLYASQNTVEGLYTLKSIKELIKREHVKMPIIDLISDIIIGKKEKEEILKFLIDKK